MSAVEVEQHPLELIAQADDLVEEADKLYAKVVELRREAARLRSRGERELERAQERERPTGPPDPLLSAAALAIEDLGYGWTIVQLGVAIQVRDQNRLAKIVSRLIAMGLAQEIGKPTQLGDHHRYRSVDPEEARTRDALRELGTCTKEQLAEQLEVPVESLVYYIDVGRERGWCSVAEDGHLMFLRPGSERVITRRRKEAPPERAVVQAPQRAGGPVEFTGKGAVPNRGSTPKAHADYMRRRAEGKKGNLERDGSKPKRQRRRRKPKQS